MLYEVIDATVIEPAECPIRRELALLAANLDTRFLRVGTTLAEAIAMIDRIIGGLDTIVDALDEKRAGAAAPRLDAVLGLDLATLSREALRVRPADATIDEDTIAARLADTVIVTDDNPRGEEPASIRAAILAAAPGAVEIGDRGEAIRAAVTGLSPGDVLVVAGKGHETGQIVGERVLPFSDHAVIRAAIAQVGP